MVKKLQIFGFKSFTDSLKSIDFISFTFDAKQKIHNVSLASKNELIFPSNHTEENQGLSTENLYRGLLRKKGWRFIPKNTPIEVYNNLLNLEPLTRNEIAVTVMQQCNGTLSATNLKKALSIFMKASLFKLFEQNNDESKDKKWTIIQKNNYLLDVDKAILERLVSSVEENMSKLYWSVILKILYSSYGEKGLKLFLTEIQREKAKS